MCQSWLLNDAESRIFIRVKNMAAIYGQKYFWNITVEEDYCELRGILKEEFSILTLVIGILLVIVGPFVIVANGIVIIALYKDPYKQLQSSASNIIIGSMAVSDFLYGFYSKGVGFDPNCNYQLIIFNCKGFVVMS